MVITMVVFASFVNDDSNDVYIYIYNDNNNNGFCWFC